MVNSHGRLVTFYSYKGGVGRSMLLANVAYILAYCGKRVLVVDWDLEAPGLEHYFAAVIPPTRPIAAREGVIDLLASYRDFVEGSMAETGFRDAAALFDDRRYHHAEQLRRDRELVASLARYRTRLALPDDFGRGGGGIDFVPAGRRKANPDGDNQSGGKTRAYSSYAQLVTTFDWDAFYRNYAGAEFLGIVATRMARDYDYVLVDSRTGLGESAAVSTISLADDLVVCFVASNQALDGAIDTARDFEDRDPLYRGGRPSGGTSRLFPVPMRMDRDQRTRYSATSQLYRTAFADILQKYVDNQGKYWSDVEIPYVGNYAFEELAGPTAGLDPKTDPYQQAAKRIAMQIAVPGLDLGRLKTWEETNAEIWASYAERVRRSVAKKFQGIVVSYARQDLDWAQWIKSVAEHAGFRVELHVAWNGRLETLQGRIKSERPWCLVPLLSEHYVDSRQSRDAAEFWNWAKSPHEGDVRLHPVMLGAFAPTGSFSDAFGVHLDDQDEELARETLLELLAAVETSAGQTEADAQVRPAHFPGTGGNQPDDVRLGQGLRRARSRADLAGIMTHSLSLGRQFVAQERFREARELLDEAAELARRLKDRPRVAQAWYEIGLLERERLDLDASVAAFDKAITCLIGGLHEVDPSIRFEKAKTLRMRAEEQDGDVAAEEDRRAAMLLLDKIDRPAMADRDGATYAEVLAERGALHLLNDRNRGENEDSYVWRARREYGKARRRFQRLPGGRLGEVRAEVGMGEVALASRLPTVALQHFDAARLLLAGSDAKPWQLAHQMHTSAARAHTELPAPDGRPLRCAVEHFDAALTALVRTTRTVVTAPGPTVPGPAVPGPAVPGSASDGSPTRGSVPVPKTERLGRVAARTRDPRRWADTAIELAKTLDRLDATNLNQDHRPWQATVLRLDAIRVLNWGRVTPKIEYANAIKAARAYVGDLPEGYRQRTEHLENAVRACWILRGTDERRAEEERAWIADNWDDSSANVWVLRDMMSFARNMLPGDDAEDLIKFLRPAFEVPDQRF